MKPRLPQVGGAGGEHGGRLVARALKARGVSKLFTLSGGHLFSIYDGCVAEGIDVVDFRHEQAAAFAAIGWAKATREPGVCALTAGAGVTNGISAIATAQADGVPHGHPRRPRARDALGDGLAPGDRPPSLRLAAGEVGRDRQGDRRHPAPDRRGDRHRDDARARADLRRLSARRRLHGGRSRDARMRRTPRWVWRKGSRRPRSCSPAPSARRSWPAPTSTGRGRRRQLVALAESLGCPGLPERHGPRLRPSRPRALLLARPRRRPQGLRRRAGDRRARSTSDSASARRSAPTRSW